MFYDLNIPWSPDNADLPRIIAFLDELGYNVIALTHTISGKLPKELTNPIPPNPVPHSPNIRILSRVLLIFDDPGQTQRLQQLSSLYDIVSLRPTSEKLLLQACSQPEYIDLISLDFNQRLPYALKHKLVGSGLSRGLKFEINYGPIATGDVATRRNIISNAVQLIRATRGRGKGIIISSEAKRAVGCRAPVDVVNLATFWGLSQEKGRDAVGPEARAVVVRAEIRRRSYRNVIDVIDLGITCQLQQPQQPQQKQTKKGKQSTAPKQQHSQQQQGKRKADEAPVSSSSKKGAFGKGARGNSDNNTVSDAAGNASGETGNRASTEQQGKKGNKPR